MGIVGKVPLTGLFGILVALPGCILVTSFIIYTFNNLYANPSARKSVSIIFIPSMTFSSSSR